MHLLCASGAAQQGDAGTGKFTCSISAGSHAGYGIELDVQLTKDDVPVVFHDFTLQRVCAAAGKIRDFTLEELKQFRLDGTKEAIPTLAEVLQLVDGQVPLLVEMK